MPYIIIEEESLQEVVDTVTKFEQKGFTPCGGISYAEEGYMQAMYKELDKPIVEVKTRVSFEDVVVVAFRDTPDPLNNQIEVRYSVKGKLQDEIMLPEITRVSLYNKTSIKLALWEYLNQKGMI